MRNIYSVLFLILFLCMLLIPLGARGEGAAKGETISSSHTDSEQKKKDKTETFKVKKGEEIITLSAKEYVVGVVAAEMPALYNEEALKAQAVAAYTYALYKKAANASKTYDITADFATDQAFITENEMKEKWGENFSPYFEKISSAVSQVLGEHLSFEGKPILALYHAISAGQTEDAAVVWGNDYPYLRSVESEGDRLADGFQSEAAFSPEQLCELLGIDSLKGESGDLGNCEKSECGTVLRLVIGGCGFTGSEIREALSLRSENFSVSVADGKYVFLVRGYGHGVGMSQHGADFLGDRGYTYREILSHYYKGALLKTKSGD